MTSLGTTTIDGLTGASLLVSGPPDLKVTFLFGTDDSRLLGYVSDGYTVMTGESPVATRSITRVLDYRELGGVSFPFRLEMRVRSGAPGAADVTVVTEVLEIERDLLTEDTFRRSKGRSLGKAW